MPKQKKYLDCPIFSLLCLSDCFVVSLGGGGKRVGLVNSIQLFPLPRLGLQLKDPFFTLELGDDIVEGLRYNAKRQILVGNSEHRCIAFSYENKTLSEVAKFVTDFAVKEPYQNDAVLNLNGDVLATGGDDGCVRLWDEDFQQTHEFPDTGTKVTSLDFHQQQPLLLATADNATIKFINYVKREVTQTLVLKNNPLKLKFLTASFFGPHTQFFTVSNPMKGIPFLTFWMIRPDNSVIPLVTHQIGAHPITASTVSQDGHYLGLGGSDGYTSIFNIRSGEFQCRQESHEMIVKGLSFTQSGRFLLSGSPDFTYEFQANEKASGWFMTLTKLYVLIFGLVGLAQLLLSILE